MLKQCNLCRIILLFVEYIQEVVNVSVKNRSVTLYFLNLTKYKARNIPEEFNLKDEFEKIINYISELNEIDKKVDDKSSCKIYYLESWNKDEEQLYNLQFASAKYNHVTEVIDTITLTSRGKLKKKNDGDKEKTHCSIQFEDNENAYCLVEDNYSGIGAARINNYFNRMAEKYYESIKNSKFYKFDMLIVPNEEFLEELGKMKKISVARLFVDKSDINVSDFFSLSGKNDVRDDVEIVVKPIKGLSLMTTTIKDIYNNKNDKHKIKRILINGESKEGPVCLDTEKMKTKHNIAVETEFDTGLVKTESIFEEFKTILMGDGGDEAASSRD